MPATALGWQDEERKEQQPAQRNGTDTNVVGHLERAHIVGWVHPVLHRAGQAAFLARRSTRVDAAEAAFDVCSRVEKVWLALDILSVPRPFPFYLPPSGRELAVVETIEEYWHLHPPPPW